jgi:CRISPR-associated endonuclease/helicase Cas3
MAAPDFMEFWGKASPADDCALPAHPLPWHALDVAAAFEVLLDAWPGTAGDLLAAFDAPPEHRPAIVRTLASLVALHDIGKFAWAFQAKVPDRLPAVFAIRTKAGPYRHDLGGALLYDADSSFRTMLDALITDPIDATAVLDPIFFHHGRLRDAGYDLTAVFRPEGVAAARAFTAAVPDLFGATALPRLRRDAEHALSWRLAGLVALADWLGSNARWFAYAAPDRPLAAYLEDIARPAARRAIHEAGLAAAEPSAAGGFAPLTGSSYPATSAQSWAETVVLAEGAGLYVLEDAMGSGKTEAALVLAHRLMQAGCAEGVFVALPTMATANALFDRLEAVYRRLFAGPVTPSLALAHSAASLHPGFRRALDIGSREDRGYGDDAGDETASAQCTRWIAEDRRRAFFADLGVGTIDQALMAVLPATHAPMRQLGLSRRILIIDEAHAYDAYMQQELATLIEFQAALGGSTIVLSATLPRTIKAKLAAAFSAGRTGTRGAAPAPVRSDYPLATAIGATVAETPVALRSDLARAIAATRVDGPEEALQRVVEHVAIGAAIVYIRNTVDDAIDTVAALQRRGIAAHLFHARFALGDRLTIERDVIRWFGRNSMPDQRRGRVLVATQVVEQSLDIDFDAMLTDLAPIDLMIQRAGRLWRHKDRPRVVVERPVLEVVSPVPVDDPPSTWVGTMFPKAQWVYRDHALLWLSARDLFERGALTVPDDLRSLVDGVYGPDAEARIPKGLTRQWQDATGAAAAAAGFARQNVLRFRDGYRRGSAHVWQDDLDIPTRLAEPTTTFRLAHWDGQTLRPWIEDADERRAWRLSETSVRTTQAAGRAPGSPAEGAATRLESIWRGRHDAAVLLPFAGPDCELSLVDSRGRFVTASYNPGTGLSITADQDSIKQ